MLTRLERGKGEGERQVKRKIRYIQKAFNNGTDLYKLLYSTISREVLLYMHSLVVCLIGSK